MGHRTSQLSQVALTLPWLLNGGHEHLPSPFQERILLWLVFDGCPQGWVVTRESGYHQNVDFDPGIFGGGRECIEPQPVLFRIDPWQWYQSFQLSNNISEYHLVDTS